jgi:hypothetical protein
MGGVPSQAERTHKPTVHDFKPPENWRLEHVEAVHRHWINGNHDFAMDRATWERFLKQAIPTAEDAARPFYSKFDTNDARMINVVEVMSGLCIMCQATVIDKIRFLFDMNDFNGQGSLSYDETVVMLYLTATAAVLMSGKGVVPEESTMESIADEAFVAADIDVSDRIGREGFIGWMLDFLNITEDTPSVGLREFLKRFKALKAQKLDKTAGQLALEREIARLE